MMSELVYIGKTLVATAISDIHLSVDPPRFRSVEKDWLEVQRKYLEQAFRIAHNNGKPVPLLMAGDVFNASQPPPEIIHFALDTLIQFRSKYLVPIFAIPGNHDLPNHRYEDMSKSAYGILVKAGIIRNVAPKECINLECINLNFQSGVRLWGFPCGTEVTPKPTNLGNGLDIALIHAYIWGGTCSYKGAPEDCYLTNYYNKLSGYDVAVFGDNHLGFYCNRNTEGSCSILNCGTLLKRKRDELGHSPSVGFIYSDGTIERIFLNKEEDKYADLLDDVEHTPEPMRSEEKEALEAFSSIGEQSLNFADFLRKLTERKNIRLRVKELILESLDGK